MKRLIMKRSVFICIIASGMFALSANKVVATEKQSSDDMQMQLCHEFSTLTPEKKHLLALLTTKHCTHLFDESVNESGYNACIVSSYSLLKQFLTEQQESPV